MYIVASKIRALAKTKNKRVSKAYLEYLSRRIERMVNSHMHILGSRLTLNVSDAAALDASRLTST